MGYCGIEAAKEGENFKRKDGETEEQFKKRTKYRIYKRRTRSYAKERETKAAEE